MKLSGRTRKPKGGSLAEIGPVLFIFMIFFVLPFLDLLSFGMGVSTVMLVSNWGARQAGPCNTFTDAKKSIQTTEDSLKAFRHFAKMSPHNGGDSGVDIELQVTKLDGSSTKKMFKYDERQTIPNQPPDDASKPDNPEYNTSNSLYQYVVTGSYDVAPWINFGSAPFLKDIPAIGKPVPVVFVSVATVEHPDGLRE